MEVVSRKIVENNRRNIRELCWVAVSSRLHMTIAVLDQSRRSWIRADDPQEPRTGLLTFSAWRNTEVLASQDQSPPGDNIIDKQSAVLGIFGQVIFSDLSMLQMDTSVTAHGLLKALSGGIVAFESPMSLYITSINS